MNMIEESFSVASLARANYEVVFRDNLAVGQSVSVSYVAQIRYDFGLEAMEVPASFEESMAQIQRGEVLDLDDVLNEPDDE